MTPIVERMLSHARAAGCAMRSVNEPTARRSRRVSTSQATTTSAFNSG
jgi:hypothetical protein